MAIPHTLVVLEDSIARVTEKLGSPEFRELTGAGGECSIVMEVLLNHLYVSVQMYHSHLLIRITINYTYMLWVVH